jgi:nicotinamide riboside kinase
VLFDVAANPPVGAVLCVAIVGAESTGKTTLAQALAAQLREEVAPQNLRVAWVPEVLRDWCNAHGRTPDAHEQTSLLHAQHDCITAAAERHAIVICDTTPLMTAVYSRIVFGDCSLDEHAAELHARSIQVTLLTALDLPWVADGLQRDGPQVQLPVDQALRELMLRHGIAYDVVSGQGPARLVHARSALQPILQRVLGSITAPQHCREPGPAPA